VQRTWTVSETVAGADRAAWSPDGQRLAFSDSKRLTVANVDGSDPKVIAGCGGDPTWSPDGAWIAYIACSGELHTQLNVVSSSGGTPIRLSDIADRLNAMYLDWLFPVPVVADVILQLQANWMADYRNSSGIVVEDGPAGPTLTIEDSSRVDPWIVRQAQRAAASCTERLAEFSRRDRPSGD